MKVPFNDLQKQYVSNKHNLDAAVSSAINEFNFIRGGAVQSFEDAFASMLGLKHCIATANGTDSIFLILKAFGIAAGDEVITPAWSWISSAETISLTGATPVFVDADPHYYTIDIERIEERITSKTKAIIVVHLYGQAADVSTLKDICDRRHLILIEDCAQAHLTAIAGKPVGTFGHAAAFSFYPTKNLGAYGDAGAVVSNDDAVAVKIRRLANHGALIKDDHLFEGINSRMDTLQAAILLAKLPSLETWNTKRFLNATRYIEQLRQLEHVTLPKVREATTHTFHLFVIKTRYHLRLQQWLMDRGVQSIIHYPKALPNLHAYQHLKYPPNAFPVASALQEEVLSLPIYPELTTDQIDYVCENIKEFFEK
ncbi:DegT/DnrJ/EryC1/StrS family aminotransferase [Pseudochryseolinea flava]|uniref:Erythromycin biosynthesis sensory transduction protein eryC1 n=1 Tax=Pseudochryseolinea flava TaxID=2059302 RepID=A0A364Y0Y1_9BACT|nr:DegT/DnrJ/EryC1/StrS family aminotransferase [Pseudochryseolinea flava]RAV99756.1 erythromycin biosynthesis sensory transduction protein eryC1 [Pseudochryseolinea flava]